MARLNHQKLNYQKIHEENINAYELEKRKRRFRKIFKIRPRTECPRLIQAIEQQDAWEAMKKRIGR